MTDSRGWPALTADRTPSSGSRAEAAQARADERARQREARVADRAAEAPVFGLRASQLGLDTGLTLTTGRRRRTGTEAKASPTERARDTSGFATIVDPDRIRALAARGISVAGIAAAFGISADSVEATLRDGPAD